MALSYCWGDLQATDQITLNHIYRVPHPDGKHPGICLRHTFNVTKNLHQALQYVACNAQKDVREGTATHMGQRGWWIDAICVDQKNAEERAQQVARMGDIYSQASMVLVWLDVQLKVGEQALRTIALLIKMLREKYGSSTNGHSMTAEQLQYIGSEAPFGHAYCDSVHTQCRMMDAELTAFFSNPWFRRIWVIQEICQANANALVAAPPHLSMPFVDLLVGYRYCGARFRRADTKQRQRLTAMPSLWYRFVLQFSRPSGRAASTASPDDGTLVGAVTEQLSMHEQQLSRTSLSILHLFCRGLPFGATDSRDKLFALFGLARETCVPTKIPREISVRYDKSDVEVFIDFSKFCIKQYRNLSLFEGVKKTARLEVLTGHAHSLPADYEFPPRGYPTWALWHACKEGWAADVSKPTRYDGNSVTKSDFIDVPLLDCDPDPVHLALYGRVLDEVDKVIPTVPTDRTANVAFVPTPSTTRTLHTVWQQVLEDFKIRSSDSDGGQKDHSAYGTDADLFDGFLHAVCCDKFLRIARNNQKALDRGPTTRAYLAEYDTIMEGFVSYWLQGLPDDPDAQGRSLIDGDLPAAVKTIGHRLIKDHNVSVSGKSAGQFQYALHHMLGRCFFITRRGSIGLGPVGTQPGDRLVALRGARLASVLRTRDGEIIDRSVSGLGWLYIGEADVPAWMDGRFTREEVEKGKGLDEVYILV